jgi:Cytochrome c7 and related cytochrome c
MRRVLTAWLLCVVAACAQNPPPPRDAIKFDHVEHLREGIQCTRCHSLPDKPGPGVDAGAAEELRSRPMLPTEAQCRQCHDKGDQKASCDTCHEHPEAARGYADKTRATRFDHAAHVERKVTGCVKCHGIGVSDESVNKFAPRIPPMRVCTGSCHAEDMPALRCGGCHDDLHRYTRSQLQLVRHPPGFLKEHGTRARAQDNLCSQCHEPTFCTDCHTASPNVAAQLLSPTDVTREFIHAADFKARHAMEAQFEPATCLRCHGPSFCDGCHEASGIGGSVGQRSPHPPGWLDPLSPRGHAREARRNILTCAGCHESDAERTCTPCHRVGGIAGDPHPPGFGGGVDPGSRGVCRVCHVRGQ